MIIHDKCVTISKPIIENKMLTKRRLIDNKRRDF
jgi:hypothetical protein